MTQAIIESVEKSQCKTDLPPLNVGDTVDVHVRIIEGAEERIQVFNGVIIKMKGIGISHTITVRRIVANEGVERVFPVHSPRIAKIAVKRHGHVRRAKLYYLRERVGKKRRLRDRRRGLEQLTLQHREHADRLVAEAAAKAKEAEAAAAAAAESSEETS